MRQVVLDTETTGLEVAQGHRIIEIGCVELFNRRATGQHFHRYIQPDRAIDPGAVEVHGITNAFLADKSRFAEVTDDFLDFVRGAELIIHNAAFDVGFIDAELRRVDGKGCLADVCAVLDSLALARRLHPGQKNGLDALCKRYHVDNTHRELHGALLDARLLADVYLAMTGGQVSLGLSGAFESAAQDGAGGIRRVPPGRPRLPVIRATALELAAHEQRLAEIREVSSVCLWKSD